MILVLDREGPKGKFTLGRISSVKTDTDNIVRKVTIKYKLPQSGLNHNLVPSAYKYAERNVRNLALVVTAQECEEIETINIDEVRALNRPAENKEYTPIDEENDVPNDHEEVEYDAENQENEVFEDIDETTDEPTTDLTESNDTNSSKKESNLKELPRTSTGRIRWKPKKLDL